MPRRYVTLDVFSETALAGNPLAVVLDAEGLDTAAMQKIALEFNLSETVFVLPPADTKHRARIRIFTPRIEMPFAGHPTVGTAVLLATLDHGAGGGDHIFGLEENIGIVSCAATLGPAKPGFARFGLPTLPEEFAPPIETSVAARALGLEESDIGFENHHPTRFTAGFPFAYIPVRDLRAMGRIAPDASLLHEEEGGIGNSVYAYARQTLGDDTHFHARMFSPRDGIPEDPATGAAAATLAGVLSKFDDLAEGEHVFRIEQGYEMGRPSIIELGMAISGVRLVSATIGGAAVIVGEGTLRV